MLCMPNVHSEPSASTEMKISVVGGNHATSCTTWLYAIRYDTKRLGVFSFDENWWTAPRRAAPQWP
jgi:hypothetical protein